MFTITDAAADKVKSLITAEGNPDLVLRVAVRPGGCSGLSYEMFFDTDVAGDDLKSEHGGIMVVIDPASAPHLGGRLPRLQGRPAGRRVRDQQPQRAAQLRLRPELQLARPSKPGAHAPADERVRGAPSSRCPRTRRRCATGWCPRASIAEEPRLAGQCHAATVGTRSVRCRSGPGRSRCARGRSGRRSPSHVEELVEHRRAIRRLAPRRGREQRGDRLPGADDRRQRLRVQWARPGSRVQIGSTPRVSVGRG